MMKKSVNAVLILAVLFSISFQSCRKGEGDPLISLKTRKARVTGDWTVESWSEQSSSNNTMDNADGSTSTSTSTFSEEISGSSFTLTSSNDNTSESFGETTTTTEDVSATGTATYDIVFNKDGTFTRKISYQSVNQKEYSSYYTSSVSFTSYDTTEFTYNTTVEMSGTWNFLGRVDEYKNKERIVLNILEYSYSYTATYEDGSTSSNSHSYTVDNGQDTEIWRISTLKNKEMVIEGTTNHTSSGSSSDAFFGFTFTDNNSGSGTGTIKGVLKLK